MEGFAGAVGSIQGVTKVAAHKQLNEEGIYDVEAYRRLGNHFADESAKLGAQQHPEAESAAKDRVDTYVQISRAVCRLVARVFPLWPKCDLTGVEYVKPMRVAREKGPEHSWTWVTTHWQCQICLRGKRGQDRPPPGTCSVPPRLNPKLLSDDGHRCALIDCSD
eukprot:6103197-Pyramimonas_sp.AAC.1